MPCSHPIFDTFNLIACRLEYIFNGQVVQLYTNCSVPVGSKKGFESVSLSL